MARLRGDSRMNIKQRIEKLEAMPDSERLITEFRIIVDDDDDEARHDSEMINAGYIKQELSGGFTLWQPTE
jgi:alkanesulfonate monooxygenase SsuD/methylene tetrahydromethanopterin reductase-like flavin-dependent oxidoreductase (luciferase family)